MTMANLKIFGIQVLVVVAGVAVFHYGLRPMIDKAKIASPTAQ